MNWFGWLDRKPHLRGWILNWICSLWHFIQITSNLLKKIVSFRHHFMIYTDLMTIANEHQTNIYKIFHRWIIVFEFSFKFLAEWKSSQIKEKCPVIFLSRFLIIKKNLFPTKRRNYWNIFHWSFTCKHRFLLITEHETHARSFERIDGAQLMNRKWWLPFAEFLWKLDF